MSTGVRVPLHDADWIAEGLVESLRPGCERVEVAGSIRRGAASVGDLEIVAIPKFVTERGPGLLFSEDVERSLLDVELEALLREGTLRPAELPRMGDRYKAFLHRSGLQLDLFVVLPPATWGVILAIRTGPRAYSQRLVTEARRRGFHVADGMLHRGILGCSRFTTCEQIPTPEESDLFEALGLPVVEPGLRR